MAHYLRYIGIAIIILFSCGALSSSYAQEDGAGQTIQIYTRLHSFIGKPSWLLIIRDLDHNQNIPYLFDIKKGNNFWVAFSYGRNYLITASELQISDYQSRKNTFKRYKIKNFCHLESNGRILRAKSLHITIDGDLSLNRDSYSCHVSQYADPNFTIVNPMSTQD